MTWSTKSESFPQAIIHLDGDAFFASCEEAIHPEYHGQPVVTGLERGIASSFNYLAKRRGVKRGMRLFEIKKICPDAIIVASDYETYSLFSKRMFTIMRRYTNLVEEYSIDEGFADVTGLRRSMHKSYIGMAKDMKETVERELGLSVSVGLAPTKVLAKLASTCKKPSGLVNISGKNIEKFLCDTPIGHIWGVGPNTSNYLRQFGIKTAADFTKQSYEWVMKNLTKPHQEIWRELHGEQVFPVLTEEKTSYASISKTKTFTPPSNTRDLVYAQLVKNLENACIKARRYHLAPERVAIILKEQSFTVHGLEATLTRRSNFPQDILPIIRPLFDRLFSSSTLYRSTGIVLSGLSSETSIQGSLFESPVRMEKFQRVYTAMDTLSQKFGKHTVHLGASMSAHTSPAHAGKRGDTAERKQTLLKGETRRKRLWLPLLLGAVR